MHIPVASLRGHTVVSLDTSEYVATNTRLLREDDGRSGIGFAPLRERQVEPHSALLATCFPDDSAFVSGIVVTPDSGVFEFGFDYFHKRVDESTLSGWKRTTSWSRDCPFADEVGTTLTVVASNAEQR